MCRRDDRVVVHVFEEPPPGEVRFDVRGTYRRELRRCVHDGHVVSVHTMEMAGLYDGAYADATYGADGMRRTFERVLALPRDRSDNAGRIESLLAHAATQIRAATPRLLDVGSGTGVFPYGVQAAGWKVTASDPDERAVRHLREVAGVEAVHADFLTTDLERLGVHDVVTFNKVLEHVIDPVEMLARARSILGPGGFVYVEVPDAEGAAADAAGFDREEFFVDHHHVFTRQSAVLLADAARFRVVELDQLQEPSTKYTLRLFLSPK
jgi:2-polyprenyl-3-methyl-5-hydroxy-6-metoxy-1,4-benzoquinol methylase